MFTFVSRSAATENSCANSAMHGHDAMAARALARLARCPAALPLRPAVRASGPLRRPGCHSGPNEPPTFFARWLCGAVACVSSLVASCAPLLTPLGASRASFLTAFRSPASPFLSPLCARLHGICGRGRGAAGAVVVWASASDAVRTADEATSPNAAAYPRKARTLRRHTRFCSELFTHFHAPGLLPPQHGT